MSYTLNQFYLSNFFLTAALAMILLSCSVSDKNISFDQFLKKGEFTRLQHTIDLLKQTISIQWSSFELDSVERLIRAIRCDFSRNETEIRKQLQNTFPSASDSKLAYYEESGKPELYYNNLNASEK